MRFWPRFENEKAEGVKKEYLDAYLEGNLRYPQISTGIELFLANVVLSDPTYDLAAFYKADPSPAQLTKMRNAMNRAHASGLIPAGSLDHLSRTVGRLRTKHTREELEGHRTSIVTDDRLLELFRNSRANAIHIITCLLGRQENISGSQKYSEKAVLRRAAQIHAQFRSEPEKEKAVQAALVSFVRTLRSSEAEHIARRARSVLNLVRTPPSKTMSSTDDRNEAALHIYSGLVPLLVGGYEATGGPLLAEAKGLFK